MSYFAFADKLALFELAGFIKTDADSIYRRDVRQAEADSLWARAAVIRKELCQIKSIGGCYKQRHHDARGGSLQPKRDASGCNSRLRQDKIEIATLLAQGCL